MVRKDYEKIFSHLRAPEPPEGFLNKIMEQVHRGKQLRILKWQLVFFAVILITSAMSAVPAYQFAQASLAESGFMEFASIAFTDIRIILPYWESFASALIESLPIMSIALFLFIIFAFLESLKYVAKDIKLIKNYGF